MSKVYCGNCGAEVILPEHSSVTVGETISKESKGNYVLPMINRDAKGRFTKVEKENKKMTKAEERMNVLKAKGVDVSKYFTIPDQNGDELLMRWENGIPTVVADDLLIQNDSFYDEIIEDGYVRNTKLHRRFVLAHMWYMLNYVSWDKKDKGYDAYIRNHLGYDYQWKMMLEEIRVLSKLEERDMITFKQRSHFFNKDVVISVCRDYEDKLKKYVERLPENHCKGIPYKRIKGYDIFTEDLSKNVYRPIERQIYKMERCANYRNLYYQLKQFIQSYVKKYKLKWNTPVSYAWKEAYKGNGSYYSLRNLVMFHGCKIYTENGVFSGDNAIKYIDSKLDLYNGDGYRYFAMLKKCISDNNWEPDWK